MTNLKAYYNGNYTSKTNLLMIFLKIITTIILKWDFFNLQITIICLYVKGSYNLHAEIHLKWMISS